MILTSWISSLLRNHRQPDKFETALKLSDEVACLMRLRARSDDPFKAVLADMFFQAHPHDPRIVAAAYEADQESRVYKGPQ